MSLSNRSLGNKEFKNGNYNKALEYYTNSLQEDASGLHIIYSNMASTFMKLNDNKSALNYIIKSIKANSNWNKSWIKLGEILTKNEKYEKAIDAYTRAMELNENNNSDSSSDSMQSDVDIPNRIKQLRELINNTDTESEEMNEECNMDYNITDKKVPNIDTSGMFGKMMNNQKIMEKMQNADFQKKIMANKTNPFIIFQDPELMDVMQEMYKEYKS